MCWYDAVCIQSLRKERSLKFDFQLEFIFENYTHDVEYDIAYVLRLLKQIGHVHK